jgi:hypothetical protein
MRINEAEYSQKAKTLIKQAHGKVNNMDNADEGE